MAKCGIASSLKQDKNRPCDPLGCTDNMSHDGRFAGKLEKECENVKVRSCAREEVRSGLRKGVDSFQGQSLGRKNRCRLAVTLEGQRVNRSLICTGKTGYR